MELSTENQIIPELLKKFEHAMRTILYRVINSTDSPFGIMNLWGCFPPNTKHNYYLKDIQEHEARIIEILLKNDDRPMKWSLKGLFGPGALSNKTGLLLMSHTPITSVWVENLIVQASNYLTEAMFGWSTDISEDLLTRLTDSYYRELPEQPNIKVLIKNKESTIYSEDVWWRYIFSFIETRKTDTTSNLVIDSEFKSDPYILMFLPSCETPSTRLSQFIMKFEDMYTN